MASNIPPELMKRLLDCLPISEEDLEEYYDQNPNRLIGILCDRIEWLDKNRSSSIFASQSDGQPDFSVSMDDNFGKFAFLIVDHQTDEVLFIDHAFNLLFDIPEENLPYKDGRLLYFDLIRKILDRLVPPEDLPEFALSVDTPYGRMDELAMHVPTVERIVLRNGIILRRRAYTFQERGLDSQPKCLYVFESIPL